MVAKRRFTAQPAGNQTVVGVYRTSYLLVSVRIRDLTNEVSSLSEDELLKVINKVKLMDLRNRLANCT